jgi:hypothetical protein
MRSMSIRQALQHVVDHPELETDEMLVLPVHELVCRTLFEIANNPMTGKPRDASKANAARTLIFDRMVGKRAPGSHPATKQRASVEFVDMTGKEVGK